MALIYDDSQPRVPYNGRSVWSMDGTRGYLRHYQNQLYLTFVANNTLATRAERAQALAELKICERKLRFWENHPTYEHEKAMRGVEELKRSWRS